MLRGEGDMSPPLSLPVECCGVEGEGDMLLSTTNEGEGKGDTPSSLTMSVRVRAACHCPHCHCSYVIIHCCIDVVAVVFNVIMVLGSLLLH